jgi:hypothetical protein
VDPVELFSSDPLAKCPADILVISATCHVDFKVPSLFKGGAERISQGPARVFLGCPNELYERVYGKGDENAKSLSTLVYCLSLALEGDADYRNPSTFSNSWTLDADGRLELSRGQPDGYVTLREALEYVHDHPSDDESEKYYFEGTLGLHDVVLTRSKLPVE